LSKRRTTTMCEQNTLPAEELETPVEETTETATETAE
jgi:hypothetical protein